MRLFSLACFGVLLSVTAFADRQFTDEQWQSDIDTYVEKLKTTHKNAFHAVSQADFEKAVGDLVAQLPKLSDQQIAFEMSRLASLIGDGHTWISPSEAVAAERIPVEMFEFTEGLFVVRALEPHAEVVGAQVVAIGGKPTAELLKAAEAYTSRDNEWTLLARRCNTLSNRVFLENQGAATAGNPVEFTLKYLDGREAKMTIPTVPRKAFIEWLDAPAVVPEGAPLYRQRPSEPYWVEYLQDDRAVYMKFNAVTNKPGGPHLAKFSEELMALIDEKKAEKLIIDARDNGGGNGDLLKPLIRRIAENKRINRPGRLFVITGRNTFSAALMLAVRMDLQTETLFAGEPGSGKPNSYSERTDFTLPITGMTGSISSRFHEEGGPGDAREFVAVDIPVVLTAADYFGNRDAVLEAVLAYKK